VTVDFVGVKPPKPNVPLIELETSDGKIVDLYNESTLRTVVLDERGLAFEFTSEEPSSIVVRFCSIRNLRVEQPPDWAPEESTQIEHLLVREEGPWPRVVFKAGGLEYEFDCSTLCLALERD
jgi:hypothetical protein